MIRLAADCAGGIYGSDRVSVSVQGSRVESNAAGDSGGGMHVQLDSTLGITNTTVEYNNATGQGGSLYGNGGEKVANFRHYKKELSPNMC